MVNLFGICFEVWKLKKKLIYLKIKTLLKITNSNIYFILFLTRFSCKIDYGDVTCGIIASMWCSKSTYDSPCSWISWQILILTMSKEKWYVHTEEIEEEKT